MSKRQFFIVFFGFVLFWERRWVVLTKQRVKIETEFVGLEKRQEGASIFPTTFHFE